MSDRKSDSLGCSIVITCYNYAQYLEEAIESALNQTIPCEVIVVDDGSADNTREICEKFPVKYIYQENKGLSAARNTGIKAAKGEYIIPLDADDKIDENFAEKTIGFDGITRTALQTFGDESVLLEPSPYTDLCVNNQIFVTSTFPKKAWEEVGGYDEEMMAFEDWDFWFRLIEHGYPIKTINEPLFLYRIHKGQMTSNNNDKWRDYLRKKHKCESVQ